MKILFLNTFYAPHIKGGAEVILQEQAVGLMKLGHEITVLCTSPDPGLRKTVLNGVTVYRAGLRNIYFQDDKSAPSALRRTLWHAIDMYNPFMMEHIRNVVSAEKPDVISSHNLTGWSIAAWDAASEYGIPIVQVLHDHYLLCPKSTMFNGDSVCGSQCRICHLMRLRHATASNKVAAVVGVSNYILDRFTKSGYFSDTQVREVIHNVRDFSVASDAGSMREGKVDVLTFGFIGALNRGKGIELLLETFQNIATANWRLIVAGTGKKEYQEYLEKKYSDPRICFPGYCEAEKFYKMIDICVAPSLWEEALGMVVSESLQFGVPVIGSCRGGIPEMLRHGISGLLFDPDEDGDLGLAMMKMAGSINTWKRNRPAIIENSLPFKDVSGWLKRWECLYNKVS